MFNRREVLAGGAAASAVLMSGCFSARTHWQVLRESDVRTLTALCDQIIPADDWPSASQAGVITFVDQQLLGPYRRHRKAYRQGIEQTEKLAHSRFGVELAHASQLQQFEIASLLEHQNPAF